MGRLKNPNLHSPVSSIGAVAGQAIHHLTRSLSPPDISLSVFHFGDASVPLCSMVDPPLMPRLRRSCEEGSRKIGRYFVMDNDLDSYDIYADEASKKARPVGKFAPKTKFRPQRKDAAKTSVTSSQTVQTIESAPSELSEPIATANPSQQINVVDSPTYPDVSTELASVPAGEPIVSRADLHDHDRDLRREGMDVLDTNMPELPAKYDMDSVPKSHQADVLDLSSLGLTHALPTEETSELPLNEESMNLMEVAELDTWIHRDDLPEVPAKLASRRAKTGTSNSHAASDPSSQQQSSQENGTRKPSQSRKGKTKICELVDEDRDEVLATGETEECSPIEKENSNNDENQEGSESKKKRSKRNSKKNDDGKEKPAKKSKKAKEVSEQGGAKPKKFRHSTRRRRVVDKTLLETHEDDIEYEKVPLRDLIILAEHREREMKREGAAAAAQATKQSIGNTSGLYNDGDFNYEEGRENNDEQGSPAMVDTTEYFNYQSHMDKTCAKRWSKQETELFYEAVRMFGSDLYMITVRLPGRSRREVKLKYKKEEREHIH